MSGSTVSGRAFTAATKKAMEWIKTEHAEKWAQLLGDAREAEGLPRETVTGRRTRHGTFKSWVKHIERGETPCALCATAFEAATAPLVRPPADDVPPDPVELPKVPGGPEVLQCEECDFTVDASSPTRRQAIAMHVRRTHNRALLDSESKPVARSAVAA